MCGFAQVPPPFDEQEICRLKSGAASESVPVTIEVQLRDGELVGVVPDCLLTGDEWPTLEKVLQIDTRGLGGDFTTSEFHHQKLNESRLSLIRSVLKQKPMPDRVFIRVKGTLHINVVGGVVVKGVGRGVRFGHLTLFEIQAVIIWSGAQ